MQKPEKPTILFVDRQCSEALALQYRFDELVPTLYAMVCDLTIPSNEIKPLIERLSTTVNFEQFHLMVNSPLSDFNEQISIISSFDDSPIEKILLFSSKYQISKYKFPIQIIPSFDIIITDQIHLTLPPFNCFHNQISLKSEEDLSWLTSKITMSCQQFNMKSFKIYYVGDFSSKLAKLLEPKHPDESTDALLLIDRNKFCYPLFVETDSYLDQSCRENIASTLFDYDLVQAEIDYGPQYLLQEIAKIINFQGNQLSYNSLFSFWSKLPPQEIEKVMQTHPMIPILFSSSNSSNQKKVQDNIIQGVDLDEIISSVPSISDGLRLLWFSSTFNPSGSIDSVLEMDTNHIYSPKYVESILLSSKHNHKLEVPPHSPFVSVVKSVIDSAGQFDSQIKSHLTGGLTGIFKKTASFTLPQSHSFTLPQSGKFLIFVLGGISFSEIHSLTKALRSVTSQNNFFICSDNICSSIDPFLEKF